MPRLFFALWPSDPEREEIERFRRSAISVPGRQIPKTNLHITLAFLGEVQPDRVAVAEAVAAQQAGRPFSLCLDTVGWWKHSRVAWLAPAFVPDALIALAGGLAQALAEAGIRIDPKPYRPHLTLAREVREPPVSRASTESHPDPAKGPVGLGAPVNHPNQTQQPVCSGAPVDHANQTQQPVCSGAPVNHPNQTQEPVCSGAPVNHPNQTQEPVCSGPPGIRLEIRSFVLVESQTGGGGPPRYLVRRTWPLHGLVPVAGENAGPAA